MDYDAANYDHYPREDHLPSGERIIMGAFKSPNLYIDPWVSLTDDLTVRAHAPTQSIVFRARMTALDFQDWQKNLHEAGCTLTTSRQVSLRPEAPARIALFVTRQVQSPTAVLDWCAQHPDKARVEAVVSTNTSLEGLARHYGVPFLLGGESRLYAPDFFSSVGIKPDLLVLARFMRILPKEMVARYAHRIINVHHALLPAFIGANTYERAMERGVRIMGATAHYVTEVLDEGPIICQESFHVDPGMTLDLLKTHGAQYEARVLQQAVAAHVQGLLLPLGNHVVQFPPLKTAAGTCAPA